MLLRFISIQNLDNGHGLNSSKVICHTVVLADIVNAGAQFVPDPSELVVDDDLVTARSAANLDDYFNALVKAAQERS